MNISLAILFASSFLALRSIAAGVSPSPTPTPKMTPSPTPVQNALYYEIDVAACDSPKKAPANSDIVLHFINSAGTTEFFTDFFVSSTYAGRSRAKPNLGVLEIRPKPNFTGTIVVAVRLKTEQRVIVVTIECGNDKPDPN
jgi:hypothetical protein